MSQFIWVCIGSAAGGGARYLLTTWAVKALGAAFPYGTLAVNLIGSFLIALVMVASQQVALISPAVRITLATGVMGGFTTYSAFSYETLGQLQSGSWGAAGVNVAATVLGCLAACAAGWSVGRWMWG